MQAPLDDLRHVLVALTADGHSSAALLRRALTSLEAQDAAGRAHRDGIRWRAEKALAARHVPVLTPAEAVAEHVGALAELPPDLVQHLPDRDPA